MYANIFELTKCLKDCLEYCREHPDREHAEFHKPLLRDALRELEQSTDRANEEFTEWRMENRDEQLAWKHLAKQLRSVQEQLESVNAIGYFDQKVMYWDRRPLAAAVDKMVAYLRDRTDVIDFADKSADKLERQKRKALSEDDEADQALDEYLRTSKMRANGLVRAKETISGFRKALRRDIGRRSEDYQAIRWPQQVAPDQGVLS